MMGLQLSYLFSSFLSQVALQVTHKEEEKHAKSLSYGDYKLS